MDISWWRGHLCYHVSFDWAHSAARWGRRWRTKQVCSYMKGSGRGPWRPAETAGIISGKWIWKSFGRDRLTAAWFMASDATNSYQVAGRDVSSLFQLYILWDIEQKEQVNLWHGGCCLWAARKKLCFNTLRTRMNVIPLLSQTFVQHSVRKKNPSSQFHEKLNFFVLKHWSRVNF